MAVRKAEEECGYSDRRYDNRCRKDRRRGDNPIEQRFVPHDEGGSEICDRHRSESGESFHSRDDRDRERERSPRIQRVQPVFSDSNFRSSYIGILLLSGLRLIFLVSPVNPEYPGLHIGGDKQKWLRRVLSRPPTRRMS